MASQNSAQTVSLPDGFATAEELYLDTHASVGLILADLSLGHITAEQAIQNITTARQSATAYVSALYEADLL